MIEYDEDFKPIRGDRVNWGMTKCIIVGIKSGDVVLCIKERYTYNWYKTVNINDIAFLYPCPWYLFWQK